MKRFWLSWLAAMTGMAALIAGAGSSIAGDGEVDLTHWTPPDIATVTDDPAGALVKHGYRLFTDTANELGPTVRDPARRFAGNNLACQNCHLRGGTQPYAMPSWASQASSRNTARAKAAWRRSKIAPTVAWSAA
jgi:cytochrome c